MNLLQLDKAQKLYSRIKELESEISEIEKTAQTVANKKTKIKISLTVNDLEGPKKKEKVLDEDGSLISGANRSPWSFMFTPALLPAKKGCLGDTHEAVIPDSVALQILGVLLAEKIEARRLALLALKKIGIEV